MNTSRRNYIFLTLTGASVFAIVGIYNLATGNIIAAKTYILIALIGLSASVVASRLGKKAP